MSLESAISSKIGRLLRGHNSGPIQYFPFTAGTPDQYGQVSPSFGPPVFLVGRAILNPTEEIISGIGEASRYSVAFLFSREELLSKFPASNEGSWIDSRGEMFWNGSRYKVDVFHPTAQVGDTFLLFIALGTTKAGERKV